MKGTAIAIIIAGVLIAGAIFLTNRSSSGSGPIADGHNVSVIDGKQIIDIAVKGGYSPRVSAAKAGMPTTLRLETSGTFDCSSAITIAALGYRKNLQPSGVTEIDVPAQKAGSTIQGVCAMGMYNFKVSFN